MEAGSSSGRPALGLFGELPDSFCVSSVNVSWEQGMLVVLVELVSESVLLLCSVFSAGFVMAGDKR